MGQFYCICRRVEDYRMRSGNRSDADACDMKLAALRLAAERVGHQLRFARNVFENALGNIESGSRRAVGFLVVVGLEHRNIVFLNVGHELCSVGHNPVKKIHADGKVR